MRLNQGWSYQEQIDRSAQGLTVLDYYTQRYCHSDRAQWQQRIAAGQILLDGVEATATTQLTAGQRLTYNRPPWQEPDVPLIFETLHEDEDVVIIAKPAGLPVLPGGGFLEHTLLWQLQERYPQTTPVPIHRLGRGTSGLLLLARSTVARAVLSQQMRDRQIQKIYRALAQGTSMPDRFTVTQPIGKVPHPTLGYLYAAHPQGQPAYSECRVLHRRTNATLLEVSIQTGRPHQIRIHLAAAGHSLVGDPLYATGGVPILQASDGAIPVPGDCGYHLHAFRLAFMHPNGRTMEFVCQPPSELRGVGSRE